MMQSQAYRELAAAQMFGFGLQFVPELRWLKFMTWHIREEIEHYEDVLKMYREFTGESVEPAVNERLTQKPDRLRAELVRARDGAVPLRPRRLLAAPGVRGVQLSFRTERSS